MTYKRDLAARLLRASIAVAALSTVAAVNNNWPSFSPPATFTGNVSLDFPLSDPAVFRVADARNEVSVLDEDPVTGGARTPSGWDINDARFGYDRATDTLYVGEYALSRLSRRAAVVAACSRGMEQSGEFATRRRSLLLPQA
jgi:hypothetical protein